jgi:ferredoxin
MHALVAGGFLGGSALLAFGVLPRVAASHLFLGLVALNFAAMCAGAVMVGARRLPTRPARLSGGQFQVLPILLLAYGGGGAALGVAGLLGAAPLGWVGLLLLGASGSAMVGQVRGGPMRHALAGAVHLAAHPRPERFGGGCATALTEADLGNSRLGVETPADFTWNQLAGFDACIQCGRCETACPAFAAGNPLNPKKLIQDLAACMAPGEAPVYAGNPHPGRKVALQQSGNRAGHAMGMHDVPGLRG